MDHGLRDELLDLTASVRAYLEWHAGTGAAGLPPGSGVSVAPAQDAPMVAERTPEAAQQPPPDARHAPPPDARRPAPPEARPAPPEARHAPPPDAWRPAPPEARPAQPRPRPYEVPAEAPPLQLREQQAEAWHPAPPPDARPAPPPDARPAGAQPSIESQAAGDTPQERHARLALLAEQVRSCQKCALHQGRSQTVFSRGDPMAELVFVGEGPGYEEDQQGLPFVGPAGQLLDRMIAAMGYDRDAVYICNIVKCRPPKNRKPEPDEMAACNPYLAAQIAALRPRAIVALGTTAVQGLTGTTEGIMRLRGKWKLYKGSIPLMPTFHPAYLLRQPAAKREVWNDLKEVLRSLGKKPPERS